MIEILQSILALVVTLSILVTFHEFGHFWVARRFNVHVLRFSVGFGKRIFSHYGKPPAPVPPPEDADIQTRSNEPLSGTEFAVSAIPLGGYVKMLDEREGYVPDDQLHLAFNRKPVLQRIAIVAAGPIANFILAIVAYWLLFSIGVTGIKPLLGHIDPASPAGKAGLTDGQEVVAVDGYPTRTWSDVNMRLFERIGETGDVTITAREPGSYAVTNDYVIPIKHWMSKVADPYPVGNLGLALKYPHIPAVIGGLLNGEPAMKAGLKPGDKVIAVDGKPIDGWEAFVGVVQKHPDNPLDLSVSRGGEDIHVTVTPRTRISDGKALGYIGASRQSVSMPKEMQRVVRYPFYEAVVPALKKTWAVTGFTLESIKKMLMGAISHKNLSGPITIAQIANASAQTGIESFIGFIALLSISLGVLNLLPIPVLDGGHLLYYFIEFITGKPVPERIQVWGLQVGMFLIVSIMLLAFYNDLTRL